MALVRGRRIAYARFVPQSSRWHCQLIRVLHACPTTLSSIARKPWAVTNRVEKLCLPTRAESKCNASWYYLLAEWISLLANVSISKIPDYWRKNSFISCARWQYIGNTELLFDFSGHSRTINRASFQLGDCIFSVFGVGEKNLYIIFLRELQVYGLHL